jgi:hypothetical protein
MNSEDLSYSSPSKFSVKKKLITFLVLFFSLTIVLSLTSYSVFSILSENNYKKIEDIVKSKLEVKGYAIDYQAITINPSFVPSISFNNVIFKNNLQENEILFTAVVLEVDFKLIPLLLKKEFVIDLLSIEQANLFVKRDLIGNNNWLNASQENKSPSAQVIDLNDVYLKNVTFFYSGPTFVDKSVLIEEASFSYLSSGKLEVEKLVAIYQGRQFYIKGLINNLSEFLQAKGTSIAIDLRADEALLLKIKGDLGSESLPTEQGLEFSVSGQNVATWVSPFFASIPETDSFFLKGKLTEDKKLISLVIDDSTFVRKSSKFNIAGNISKEKIIRLDLSIKAQGKSLDELSKILLLDEAMQENLPLTESYSISAKLNGDTDQLAVQLLDFNFAFGTHQGSVKGRIKNINKLAGMDLTVNVKGDSFSTMLSMINLELPSDLLAPESELYHLAFTLKGGVNNWFVESLKSDLSISDNKLTITSIPKTKSNTNEIHFGVETSGSDLLQLSELVKFESIPRDVKHRLKFEVNGDINTLHISKIDSQVSYKSSEITAKGILENLNTLEGFDLDVTITGLESEVTELLALGTFPENAIALSGHFTGTLKEFSFTDFIYQGARGKSSGNVFIDILSKPQIRADLGDTRYVFVRDKNKDLENSSIEKSTHSKQEETPFSFAWMDNLDVDIDYKKLFIVSDKAEFEFLGSKIYMKDGRMRWNSLQFNYRDVVINGALEIDAKLDEIIFSAKAQQMNLGALLDDLDWFHRFKGLADFDFNFQSKGLSDKELIANLKGEGKIIIHQSKVVDFGSASMNYVKALTPWRKTIADLEMDCMLASLQADNGVVAVKHLFVDAKDMYVTGGGKLNLTKSTLDFALAPRAKNKNFLDANISLFVTGPVNDPKVQVGKLSAVSDVGLKYGQWALLGPFSLALPKIKFSKIPTCEQAIKSL